MDVNLIFKIAAIGILVAVLNQLLESSEKKVYATMTTIAGVIVVILMIINEVGKMFETIKTVFGL